MMLSATARSALAVLWFLSLTEAAGKDKFWSYLDEMADEGEDSSVTNEGGRYLDDYQELRDARAVSQAGEGLCENCSIDNVCCESYCVSEATRKT